MRPMRMSLRPAPAIAALACVALTLPAAASAAPSVSWPPSRPCVTAAPVPGSVKFAISPSKVVQGTQPRLKFAIVNVGRTCLGHSAAPYALQQSGFAGWSDVPWDIGPITEEIRVLRPGQIFVGLTAPLPKTLSAGGFYRVVPRFIPDAKSPVAEAPLTVLPPLPVPTA